MDDRASKPHTLTLLIERAKDGDEQALGELFAALYPDLRRIAHARLRRQGPLTLIDTVGLVHEAYLRLVNLGELDVENRSHFLAYAARTMRSIVVDMARARQADRRGAGDKAVELDTSIAVGVSDPAVDVLRVHEALHDLARVDERLARVVEMRYFGGLSEEEIAAALGVSDRTVRRDWEKSRVLLAVALR
jgi:RNA polymerase sigma factor (TIGR02999 family)